MGATRNLVLGGSGLVGKGLCRSLEEKGEHVINLDWKNNPEHDLRTMSLEPYKDVDFVWFLAWEVGGAKYLHNKENLITILRNNSILCSNVFSFLEATGLPFLFATTQMADTNNTYGITKVLGEEWARLLGGKLARFWNVYSWEVPNERSHVIPDLVVKAMDTGLIDLMTDGKEKRQFIHINDCAENLIKIRDSEQNDVDLTSGQWVSIYEMAEIIARKLGAEVRRGEKQGFQNILEPDKLLPDQVYNYPLEKGIDEVIERARQWKKESSGA